MGCRRYVAGNRLEVLVDEDDSRSSSRVREHGSLLLVSQLHVAILKSMSISSRCVNKPMDCPIFIRLTVLIWSASTFSSASWSYLNVQQTLAHHSSQGPLCLRWCFRNQTRHLFDFHGKQTRWWLTHRSHRSYNWMFGLWLDLLGVSTTSSNFWIQFFHPIIFEGSLWRSSRWRKNLLVFDFSSFHHNSFRDTKSSECVVKDDRVLSCVTELKSFLLSKSYVDPIQRVLMYFPLSSCAMQDAVLPSQCYLDHCVLCS